MHWMTSQVYTAGITWKLCADVNFWSESQEFQKSISPKPGAKTYKKVFLALSLQSYILLNFG